VVWQTPSFGLVCQNANFYTGSILGGRSAGALKIPLEITKKMDFEKSKERALELAADYAFKNCGAIEGEMLTLEQKQKLSSLMAEKMMPFFRQYMVRPIVEDKRSPSKTLVGT